MNIFKSHITFTKQQRYGIFLLLLIICVLQAVYFFWDKREAVIEPEPEKLEAFIKEVDSLKAIEIEQSKPKTFPFNPNYITDYKGYSLGMTNEEIDRLHAYRKEGKWINSAEDFQKVTAVSDTLLNRISPYFKFPDWVEHQNKTSGYKPTAVTKQVVTKTSDLNTATALQLQSVYGVGETLANRIIKLRNSFEGGFIADVQLQDVYGLSPEVIERITSKFTVMTPRVVEKYDLNTVGRDDLVKIQHIDYPLAKEILEYRTLNEGYNSLDELLKVKGFPVQKLDIIKLYLALK